MINVTKTFLPDYDLYAATLKRAWDKAWITNNGELVQELEAKLKAYLGVKHLLFTTNGTIVLQMALKAFEITGEVITTPFSYVATTNAILWEGCTPVFVDINTSNFCLNEFLIEKSITEKTQAILATHVYGYPCEIEKIEKIAQKHSLKVIYDGAHSFGCMYKGKSLLSYGDISTCSFHATKIFHTVEGGCIITNNDEIAEKLMLFRQFGHVYDDYQSVGVNAKNSEFHAAMGLCVLKEIDTIIERRKAIYTRYTENLRSDVLQIPVLPVDFTYNYSYYPVVFDSEIKLLAVKEALQAQQVNTRRYFYPSLNQLHFVDGASCPESESISSRVLCLPIYFDLEISDVDRISAIVNTIV
ncbi:MAG: DegT/DnrJ/EryC1/StrS family aminotransferase [Bacteroidota bacterium]|nr:DegT/DnrJ/EryC1/StrS family aminotransferase [Bacteroidota bacterium]